MLPINRHLPMPHGLVSVPVRRAPKLVLPSLERSRSHLRTIPSDDCNAAVMLPRDAVMRGDDVLVVEDGTLAEIQAAPEHVLCVTGDSRLALMRAAYYPDNRHTSVQVSVDALQLEADPVLEGMFVFLGVTVAHVEAPFEPEAGVCGGGHRHGHDVTLEEDHAVAQTLYHEHHGRNRDHNHAHDHDHDYSHGRDHDHVHGPGRGYHRHHHD